MVVTENSNFATYDVTDAITPVYAQSGCPGAPTQWPEHFRCSIWPKGSAVVAWYNHTWCHPAAAKAIVTATVSNENRETAGALPN